MQTDYAQILSAAMALPPDERLQLVSQLQDTLPTPPGLGLEDSRLGGELDRRFDEYDKNPAASVSWEDARKRVEQRLREQGPR